MIKKWQSFKESNEYIRTSEVLTTDQITTINKKIKLIADKKLDNGNDGFWEVQNLPVCEFIEYCEDNVLLDEDKNPTHVSFTNLTVDDVIKSWTKEPQLLQNMLLNFMDSELIYTNIDSELNEILTEFKDEYDFEMITGCKSDNGLGKRDRIIFYEIEISDSDVSEYDESMDCYYFVPSKMLILMNITKRITLKIKELGWVCIIQDSSEVNLLKMIIYKNID